jgi:uncharacterized protein
MRGLLQVFIAVGIVSSTPALAQLRFGQPTSERKVQATLPQSSAAVWRTLVTTRITENTNTGMFGAIHPPAVRALVNTNIQISGFMLPLDATPRSRHFLISRLTPVCAFCPPGGPNEVIEVFANTPVPITDRLVVVTGRFALINDADKGLFFRLNNAQASVSR